MDKILTPTNLKAFMVANSVTGEIITLNTPTPTVETAARAVGTKPSQIVKSVLFTIRNEHILAIATGTRLIERRAIADNFKVGRKQVKLAPPDIVLTITGYPVGTVPPFGHITPIPTLIDPSLFKMDVIYAGGGAHNALVRLHPKDILRITGGKIVDLHRQLKSNQP